MIIRHKKNRTAKILITILIITIILGTGACGSRRTEHKPTGQENMSSAARMEVHVSADGSDENGDGTREAPYATVSMAAHAMPGSLIIVHGGNYGPIRLGAECSGSVDAPTVIRAASGESAVIHADDGIGISLTDISHVSVEGLETVGGTHGIEYRSTREAGEEPLIDIAVRNCTVRGVRGVHGICVYACNDLAPVRDLTIEGCEVYDCECGSSESLVINGNIDGFLIAENRIHDNNNIGIDMIGFEGTAKHPNEDGEKNPYESDQVRNGICRDNIVYNISSEGNSAYYEDGEYDLCADGIYVDGGRDIEICNNFIFNCDIGLEAATEHSPLQNELFRVSGIRVHDNVIADCTGWSGFCFGGYAGDLGFTEECEFHHNTLVDNETQIGVQRSRNNRVYANLIIGGETGIEFNEDCSITDMVNDISGNAFADIRDEESLNESYGVIYADRADLIDGFCPKLREYGSRFIPDDDMMKQYKNIDSSAGNEEESLPADSEVPPKAGDVPKEAAHSFILPEGMTLESRFALPDGYSRIGYPEGSFGSFVRNYPLKPDGSPVLLWTKVPKGNQKDHAAVFDMTVEEELDVQQCADSVMRIYAEYFRATGQYDRIRFHFVSGFLCDYSSYIEGNRVGIDGSSVNWVHSAEAEDSDRVFNEYMKIICAYASTLSMEEESVSADLHDLQIGDIFLKGGSPGHVVMVADVCEKDGSKAFLLAQGYMPAQDFHIIKNPLHENDPWYYEQEVKYPFRTQAYTFPEESFRRLQY